MIAAIVAGGKGTRLKDVSGEIPKPMVPVGGKPVLEHQVALLARWGAREVHILTGYLGHVIEQYFGDGSRFGLSIRYHREAKPLGTAGCVAALAGLIDEPFVLLYGDIVLDMNLADFAAFHRDKGSAATLAVHPNDHPRDSDLVVMDEGRRITGFIPKDRKLRWYANCVSAAVYVLSPGVFRYIPAGRPSDFVRDVFPAMLAADEPLFGYRTSEYIKDMGTTERYEKVSRDLAAGRIARFARPNRRPAIFMDRDGTLVEEVDLLRCVDDLKPFPFTPQAVKTINGSDFLSFIITNQPVVARNLCSMEDVREVHRKLETLLGEEGAYVDDIYFCPHHPDRGYPEENPLYKIDCRCRKPKTGMIEAAARDYPVDLGASWFVGDRTMDLQTGINAGLATVLVRTGKAGKDGRFDVRPDFTFDTLGEAVAFIIEGRPALLEKLAPVVDAAAARRGPSPYVIAVGGQARSGKSTLARLLARTLGERGVTARVLSLDNWLVGAPERTADMTVRERYRYRDIESDIERLLAGEAIELSRYDAYRRTAAPGGTFSLDGAHCLIVDGVAALDVPGLREVASCRLFADIPEARRRERFFAFYRWKDMPEPEIEALYRERLVDEVPCIEASKQHAQIVVRIP
ncbi:MAG: D-glycero-beta-D-manno-heptose-1,7-bisphosphate 7-phosphatase [Syntrophaceae bacterium PtaU1.Bin231]|nr:MAG: D-glycero-beta-D-manno-heptose-1,7-bisphosphate 7-phosphatase [Syntrophaceae bacterium PtaU1.Bin231]